MEFPIAVEVVLLLLIMIGLRNQRVSNFSGGLISIALGMFEFVTFGLGVGISLQSQPIVSFTHYYFNQVVYPVYLVLAGATAVYGIWLIRQKGKT